MFWIKSLGCGFLCLYHVNSHLRDLTVAIEIRVHILSKKIPFVPFQARGYRMDLSNEYVQRNIYDPVLKPALECVEKMGVWSWEHANLLITYVCPNTSCSWVYIVAQSIFEQKEELKESDELQPPHIFVVGDMDFDNSKAGLSKAYRELGNKLGVEVFIPFQSYVSVLNGLCMAGRSESFSMFKHFSV